MRLFLATLAALLLCAAPAAAAPAWLPPADVEQGLTESGPLGDVAVAPDGTAVSVWIADLPTADRVRVRIRRPGAPYGPVTELTPADGSDAGSQFASRPRVGVDQAGNFTVAWDENNGGMSAYQVQAARLPAGTGAFEPIEPVAAGTDPSVAVGGSGVAVIAFAQGADRRAAFRTGAGGQFADSVPLEVPVAGTSEPELGVDDTGGALLVWSREIDAGKTIVEARVRQGTALAPGAQQLSSNGSTDKATTPALAMRPDGRALVLWTFQQGPGQRRIQAIERNANGSWPAEASPASADGQDAFGPEVAVSPDGTATAAWFAEIGGTTGLQGAVRRPGAGFGEHRTLSTTQPGQPHITTNRKGDAFVAWTGSMNEAIFSVRRSGAGTFGSVDIAALGAQGSTNVALYLQGIGVDDLGNATALWQRTVTVSGVFTYGMQSGSFDATPPTLNAVAVPPEAAPGAPVGMAAAATDRLAVPSIRWTFGDGGSGSGPEVVHAYAAPGAYTVTITATDAAGNTTTAARSVLVESTALPVINSTVKTKWAFDAATGKRFVLLRLKATKAPRGAAVQLRCAGKKCPFTSKRATKRRNGAITMFRLRTPARAVKQRARRFRAGQRVQVRVTAPGFVGKVVKYKLKRRTKPVGRVLCLQPGAPKPGTC